MNTMKKLPETSKKDIEAFAEKMKEDILPKWIGARDWEIDYREADIRDGEYGPMKKQAFFCRTEIDDPIVYHKPFCINIKIPVDDVDHFICGSDSNYIPGDIEEAYVSDVQRELSYHSENFRDFYLKTNYNTSKEEIIREGLKYLSEGRQRSAADMMKLRNRIEMEFEPPLRFCDTKPADYYRDGIKAGEDEYCATDIPRPIHEFQDFLKPSRGIRNKHVEKEISDDRTYSSLGIKANQFGDAIVTYKNFPLKNDENEETNGQWKDKIYLENKLVAEIRYSDPHTGFPSNAKIFGKGPFQDMLQEYYSVADDVRKDPIANLVFGGDLHQSTVIRLPESTERFAGADRMEKEFLASGGREPSAYTDSMTR